MINQLIKQILDHENNCLLQNVQKIISIVAQVM